MFRILEFLNPLNSWILWILESFEFLNSWILESFESLNPWILEFFESLNSWMLWILWTLSAFNKRNEKASQALQIIIRTPQHKTPSHFVEMEFELRSEGLSRTFVSVYDQLRRDLEGFFGAKKDDVVAYYSASSALDGKMGKIFIRILS